MANQADNQGAKFFGKDNPFELRELENRSVDATDEELAEAARYVEIIFGDSHAWCGGWALRLRGSERRTEDLDVVIRAPSTASIWEQLKPHSRIILYYYKHVLEEGGDQFKIFVDLGEERVVCVDVILAGRPHTPTLETRDDVDEVYAPVNGTVYKKRVVSLRWQVSQKLHAIATRRKESDCTDLVWLITHYLEIGTWIQDEDESKRKAFFDWYYDNEMDDAEVDVMKRYLGLEVDKR